VPGDANVLLPHSIVATLPNLPGLKLPLLRLPRDTLSIMRPGMAHHSCSFVGGPQSGNMDTLSHWAMTTRTMQLEILQVSPHKIVLCLKINHAANSLIPVTNLSLLCTVCYGLD
jgi:hypothetical protein